MKRAIFSLIVCGLLSVMTAAEMLAARAAEPTLSERVRQFQTNRELLKILVRSSLELADEPVYARRVELCSKIAEYLAIEMHRAAKGNDGARVAELGHYLHTLQKQGVAAHLKKLDALPAKDESIPAVEKYMRGIQEAVQAVEDELHRSPDKTHEHDVIRALEDVREGQKDVEEAVKHRKSRDKPQKR